MARSAQDAGPFGVRSNAVLPGWVRTEMAERSARAEAERRGITTDQVWTERAAGYPENIPAAQVCPDCRSTRRKAPR